MREASAVLVLGVVVVERRRHHDLARHGRLGLLVAEHGHLDLAPGHAALDEHQPVVAERQVQRLGVLAGRLDARDAHRRARVGRLDEHRRAQPALDLGKGQRVAAVRPSRRRSRCWGGRRPRAAAWPPPCPCTPPTPARPARRRARPASAKTPGPRRPRRSGRGGRGTPRRSASGPALGAHGARARARLERHGVAGFRLALGVASGQRVGVGGHAPPAVAVDVERRHAVAVAQRGAHVAGGQDRDLVLGRLAAEHEADVEVWHGHAPAARGGRARQATEG